MFNEDFYPTPPEVIERMLHGFDLQDKVILEPSAGSGNIVETCLTHGAREVLACEVESKLRRILAGKCKLIADDFLTVRADQVSHIDAIIMNPPFSADENHIIHAWEIAPPGCQIIALCNWDTYKKRYFRSREILGIAIDQYGSCINLGRAFSSSERPTNAEIGLISMTKPGQSSRSEFDGFFMEEDEEAQGDGIMPYNFIRDLVNRYVSAVRIFDKQLSAAVEMNRMTEQFYSSKLAMSITEDGAPKTRNDFKKDMQKQAWGFVFSKMNMQKYTTAGLRSDINKFVEQQENVPFTMRNIYRMIEIVIGTQSSRMDRALLEVFDKVTQHYHENRYAVEGWKTNSNYLLTEKFILPRVVTSKWSGSGLRTEFSSRSVDMVEDMLKAICYLTGRNYDECVTFGRYCDENNVKPNEMHTWEFFNFRAFGKGTVHFKFNDRKIWEQFNLRIAKLKGYPLPEFIKKTAA